MFSEVLQVTCQNTHFLKFLRNMPLILLSVAPYFTRFCPLFFSFSFLQIIGQYAYPYLIRLFHSQKFLQISFNFVYPFFQTSFTSIYKMVKRSSSCVKTPPFGLYNRVVRNDQKTPFFLAPRRSIKPGTEDKKILK